MEKSNYESFFKELGKVSNHPICFKDKAYERNVSKYSRSIHSIIKPESKSQVIQVVKLANEYRVGLHPISRGGNWAFGSRLPVEDGSVILDLSNLDKITNYDANMGTLRLEPGVSQGQLSDFLLEQGSSFFVDVTGSGYHTSIIGNSLERGIAYNSLRAERILDLEILLGSGDVIRTGYGAFGNFEVNNVYRYGLGPSLDQLFFQSNYGVVLSATYQLQPVPQNKTSVQIKFKKESLGSFIEAVRKLRQNGIIDCIVHAADPIRSATTLCPLLSEKSANKYWAECLRSEEWSAIASIHGPDKIKRAKLTELKKVFGKSARVTTFTEKKIDFAKKFMRIFGMSEKLEFLEATTGLRGLTNGRATSDALLMAFYRGDYSEFQALVRYGSSASDMRTIDVDASELGVLFCVPLATLTGENANKIYEIVGEVAKNTGLMMGVTFNAMTEKLLEAVISLHFDDSTKEKAQQTLKDLYDRLMMKGFLPYRLNPDLMAIMKQRAPKNIEIADALKSLLDPQKILSSGRYQ